jgi:hypothetical protein
MSDYEVTLVNDNMQEFYVRFHGPTESEWKALGRRAPDESWAVGSLGGREGAAQEQNGPLGFFGSCGGARWVL